MVMLKLHFLKLTQNKQITFLYEYARTCPLTTIC